MFSKDFFSQGHYKFALCGKELTFPKQALVFTSLQNMSFENTVEKGEIARNEQFLLFPQGFLLAWKTFCHYIISDIVICKLLGVWKRKKFVIWEWVNLLFSLKINLFDKASAEVSAVLFFFSATSSPTPSAWWR